MPFAATDYATATFKPQWHSPFKSLLVASLLFVSLPCFSKDMADFTLPRYGSEKPFVLKQERQKGLVVINFWASWCTACIKEIPQLEKLKARFYQKAQFVAVNAGDKDSYIKRFIKQHEFSYEILQDKDKSFCKQLGVLELPRTIVVDKKGKIIYDGHQPPTQL